MKKNSAGSVGSAAFVRGLFLSLLVGLLLGLTASTRANVIQANQTYPPPNGSFRCPGPVWNFGAGASAVQLKDVAFTFFENFALISGTQTLTFNAQCSHYLSIDGGTTWSGEQAATATFVVTLTSLGGNNYDFAITSLTISNGDLPASFRFRKPAGALPGAHVVTFTPNTPSAGLFSIISTFFLPLELSQDAGFTWTPNSVSGGYGTPAFSLAPLTSEEVSHAPTLPPGDGQYYTPDQYHAAFASGIVIRNPIHNGFLGQSCTDSNNASGQPGLTNALCPPPILGGAQTEDFTSQMRFDLVTPAVTHIGPIGATVQTRIAHTHNSGVLQIFQAQMLQLNPDLGSLPPGMNLRINPDPNKPSRGITTMRPGSGPNETNIASAFALRLQITTDSGATWQDSDQFTRMNMRALPGTGFPTTVTNGTTFSIGVFEVVVDPSFAFLFAPAPTYFSYYPGYGGTNSGILTSPVMFDSATMIGESVAHVRDSVSPDYFPVAAGAGTANYPAPNSSYSNILSYADYAYIPSLFTNGTDGADEIMTEMEQLNLQGYLSANGTHSNSMGCPDPRVPSLPLSAVTVKAGPGTFGIGASLPLNRRSLGLVQQITNGAPDDFPARSFFNMFVEATIPPVPGTVANTAFPAGGAVLYNDEYNPLFIQNLYLTNLPPEATYVHGNTTAVPVRFRDNHPPYWSAGDVLGYLTLAGHGVFTNVVTASLPCLAATAAGGLLDLTLGPVGAPMPAPPIPWLRPTNTFPTPATGYGSVVNRPVDSGVTNILDDVVSYNLPMIGTLYVRDFNVGNLAGSIAPPPPYLGTNYYNPGTLVTMEVSVDGLFWFPASASGPASMIISNCTPGGPGSPQVFNTEMLSLDCIGSISGGPLAGYMLELRESPTLQSLGRHTIGVDPRGYRVSSFFDVFTEIMIEGAGDFVPATKAIRLQASMPPAVPQSVFVTQISKTNLVLNWQNSFALQTSTSLLGPWSDVKGALGTIVNGPYTNRFTVQPHFFRLRQ